jgi:hypothetical protein
MSRRAVSVAGALAAFLLASSGHGLDQPIDAEKLVLRKTASGERLSFLSRDAGFLFPPRGSADDPATGTPGGVLVEVFSTGGGYASLSAPAGFGVSGWRVASIPRASFVYKNPIGVGGASPLRFVALRQGKAIKISARATGLALTAPQLAVGIRITTGTRRSCALFGPDTVEHDEAGKFVARDALASALVDCSESSLTIIPCQVVFDPYEPMCGGLCPSGQVCVAEVSGQISISCVCRPEGVTPCFGSGYPQCGGSCSGDRACQAFRVTSSEGPVDFAGCACVDPEDTCAAPPGSCFGVGVCPAGQVCFGQAAPISACGCASP